MRKMLVIANREYQAAVRTKSFIISLVIMPVMMVGGALIQFLLKDQVDLREKKFAVVDRTPGAQFAPKLGAAVRQRNEHQIRDPETGKQRRPVFTIETVPPRGTTN